MARTPDPSVDAAIGAATLALLRERGFAGLTVEEVARAAGVGKPAIYRRHRDKAALVVAVIAAQLPDLAVPDLGDTRREMWHAVTHGFPDDADGYLRLIGGLAAEGERHPELLATFRTTLLLPRRAAVAEAVARGQARGDIRDDLDAEMAVDLLAGPLLARAFAGRPTGTAWRRAAFATWWRLISTDQEDP